MLVDTYTEYITFFFFYDVNKGQAVGYLAGAELLSSALTSYARLYPHPTHACQFLACVATDFVMFQMLANSVLCTLGLHLRMDIT